MPDTGLEGAARVAERIRNNVAGSPFRVSDGKDLLTVTISVGVAATLGEGDTPQALLKRADEAVYEAKAQGRNKVCARAAWSTRYSTSLLRPLCQTYSQPSRSSRAV